MLKTRYFFKKRLYFKFNEPSMDNNYEMKIRINYLKRKMKKL